jgi:hypothetical protein
MQKTTNQMYKTTIVCTKHQSCIEVLPPDNKDCWELFSVIPKKNKIYYTWKKSCSVSTFSSSEESFQKSLDLVKASIERLDNVIISEKSEDKDNVT